MTVESFEVEIEKIVAGGFGLARHEGQVVFVSGVAPLERHRVAILERKRDFLRAESIARLKSAPSRREPPCPHYARCGGCALMHLEPAAQLEAKKSVLLESLARNHVTIPDNLEIGLHASPELGYRNRVRFHVGPSGASLAMGFRRRASHVIEDIDRCAVATDGLNACWHRVREFLAAHPGEQAIVESVELQESNDMPGRIVGRFVVRSKNGFRKFDKAIRLALQTECGLDGLVVSLASGGRRLESGRTWVRHSLDESSWRQSAGSFFQTNRFLLRDLVAAVRPRTPVARVIDLYAGVGLFALGLAAETKEVVAVESDPGAVADGRVNLRSASGAEVRIVRADATRFARDFAFDAADYVVVDPPRGGLAKPLRGMLASSPVREICYVSCDPPAFGRDAGLLVRAGFTIETLELVDLFPNTHHFETVATFSRGALDSPAGTGSY